MTQAMISHDQFLHVRIIVGMVIGLSITRLLAGLSRFVQSSRRERVYLPHIAWAIFMLLSVLDFWWFQYALVYRERWTFAVYVFVIVYAATFFFTCTVLFPDRMEPEGDYAAYFHQSRAWLFGLLAALAMIDLVDSALKGAQHFHALGPFYLLRQVALAGTAIAAIFVRNNRFHRVFVGAALVAELVVIGQRFELPG